jgi:hypothetical protein
MMQPRLSAALIAVLLGFAPGSPAAETVAASTLAAPRPVAAAPAIDPKCATYPCYTVTVTLTGNGSGRWQSTNSDYVPDGKIDCRFLNGVLTTDSVCSYAYADLLRTGSIGLNFKVTAEPGNEGCATFWPQDALKCDIARFLGNFGGPLTADTTIPASFNHLNYDLTVANSGTGTGTVVSTPAIIGCGPAGGGLPICTAIFEYGTTIQLSANPAPGSTFGGWTGACTGQQAECLIAVIAETTTGAIFKAASASPSPSPTSKPTATPSPTASPTPAAPTASPEISPSTSASASASSAMSSFDAAATPSVAPAGVLADPVSTGPDLTPIGLLIIAAIVLGSIAFGIVGFRKGRGGPG